MFFLDSPSSLVSLCCSSKIYVTWNLFPLKKIVPCLELSGCLDFFFFFDNYLENSEGYTSVGTQILSSNLLLTMTEINIFNFPFRYIMLQKMEDCIKDPLMKVLKKHQCWLLCLLMWGMVSSLSLDIFEISWGIGELKSVTMQPKERNKR